MGISLKREFKGLNISMCMIDSEWAFDYEFVIHGKTLPMVQIGFITHHTDGSELILNDFENEDLGSEIYTTLSYGRVVQSEDDEEPTYIEVFESGVNQGMYDLECNEYKMLIYDKQEIVDVLYEMANECLKEYNDKKVYSYIVRECIYEESLEETCTHRELKEEEVRKEIMRDARRILHTYNSIPKTHTGVELICGKESQEYIDNLTYPINLFLMYPDGYTKIIVSEK